jgi:hypothetical protein
MADLLGEFGDGEQTPTDITGLARVLNPTSPPPVQAGSSLDDMLGGSDDEDLFAAQTPPPQPASTQPASALIEWQRAKDVELQEKDGRETQNADEIKAKARASLDAFNKTIAEGQEKRRVHNAE